MTHSVVYHFKSNKSRYTYMHNKSGEENIIYGVLVWIFHTYHSCTIAPSSNTIRPSLNRTTSSACNYEQQQPAAAVSESVHWCRRKSECTEAICQYFNQNVMQCEAKPTNKPTNHYRCACFLLFFFMCISNGNYMWIWNCGMKGLRQEKNREREREKKKIKSETWDGASEWIIWTLASFCVHTTYFQFYIFSLNSSVR